MASNTPNLDLLKKDPVTDGNDTFNIETMLNENWDKIDAAVGQLEEEMQEIDIPLSDETNGTRSNVAGSEKAVGLVMQAANAANLAAGAAQTKADQAFTAGNERKAEVVAALVALGVSASTSDSWDTLISKMATVIKATGNATAADVLAGKTASNANGPITGTMPNRGAGGTVTPGTTNQTKAAGYYSSAITVLGDADLAPGNIKSGVNIFGVVGTLKTFNKVTFNYSRTGSGYEYGSHKIGTIPGGCDYIVFLSSGTGMSWDIITEVADQAIRLVDAGGMSFNIISRAGRYHSMSLHSFCIDVASRQIWVAYARDYEDEGEKNVVRGTISNINFTNTITIESYVGSGGGPRNSSIGFKGDLIYI